jgi:thiamine phosphate synthase YjbQ (UPF0047 family)
MDALTDRCSVEMRAVYDIVDITDEAVAAVARSSLESGRLVAFTADPGCVLVVNEREAGLWSDLRSMLERLSTGAATTHLPLGSASVTLPIADGSLGLGTWQRLLLIELERPGPRSVILQVLDDPTRKR